MERYAGSTSTHFIAELVAEFLRTIMHSECILFSGRRGAAQMTLRWASETGPNFETYWA